MPLQGYYNDGPARLWYFIATNFWERAVALGYTGWQEPNSFDSPVCSMRKCVDYSAFIANNS